MLVFMCNKICFFSRIKNCSFQFPYTLLSLSSLFETIFLNAAAAFQRDYLVLRKINVASSGLKLHSAYHLSWWLSVSRNGEQCSKNSRHRTHTQDTMGLGHLKFLMISCFAYFLKATEKHTFHWVRNKLFASSFCLGLQWIMGEYCKSTEPPRDRILIECLRLVIIDKLTRNLDTFFCMKKEVNELKSSTSGRK